MEAGEDMGKRDYNDETLELLLMQAYYHGRRRFSTPGYVRRAQSSGSQDPRSRLSYTRVFQRELSLVKTERSP
jgi:hypothetical protein